MSHSHSFHIPVMGIAFTIDTPLKVAHFGIDSVVSLVDDILLEKLRKMYCEKFELQYNEITNKVKDFRAKRITSYLNLMNHLVDEKYSALKNVSLDKIEDIKTHLSMLPSGVVLKQEFTKLLKNGIDVSEVKNWLATHLKKGRIDVNIMTKVDKQNTFNNQKLPVEYNDAHAALRGFANSKLEAAVVLSAGLNPRLYAYMAQFDDFFPNENGQIKKKIILKVSDYRSALVQGKFLAKKGLWVSEYRVESGLNCGGHAFATDGYLLGPVLHEFKEKRGELINTITDVLNNALKTAGKVVPKAQLKIAISAQGGVGTHKEHAFLIDEYKLDSVGWGSPFLLVSEATTVDNNTLKKLVKANENDLYLSDISPLGVPFNNLKNNTKDAERNNLIFKGRPGSSCPKKFVALNKEFGEKGICTASREYQYLKLKALDAQNLSADAYEKAFNSITQKSCTCVGLGTSALLVHNLSTKVEGEGVSVCPGPNMAYYSKVMSLKNITDHIYGRDNMVTTTKRPNIFIKELNIYVDFILKKLDEVKSNMTKKDANYILTFTNNLNNGITYYKSLFNSAKNVFDDVKKQALIELDINERLLKQLQHKIKQ